MPAFLHTHSWYSLLTGASSPATLVQQAAEGGYDALALTDTNNLYGAVVFAELASAGGVRPLLGATLEHQGQHAVALIADVAGYRNLCRIISRVQLLLAPLSPPMGGRGVGGEGGLASLIPPPSPLTPLPPEGREGDKKTPLTPNPSPPASGGEGNKKGSDLIDLLAAHAEGLHLLVDTPSLATQLREAFHGRLWLEVIRPGPDPDRLLDCAREFDLPLVASTRAHLSDVDEYHTLRLAHAVRHNTLLDRVPAALPVGREHRLIPVRELRHRFRDLPEALAGADNLGGLLRSDVLPRQLILPRPRLRPNLDLVRYLHASCERGLRERGMGTDLAARERLRKELAIIEDSDLPGYFLTVRDIARETRRRGHSMALRGSAGNSLVCYLLGITDVDPLRFGLEMERFLHPGRVDLPDIDLDFDWKIRDEIIDHVIERYGREHVARISSHLFFQPRSAFRASAKVHGLSNEQVSELLTFLDTRVDEVLLPEGDNPGQRLPIPPPRGFALEPARWPRIIADARRLLGRPTHLSLHPGGIVITPHPIDEYVPVQWAAKGVLMTQFEKDAIEHIGLVKIDLLGNRALSTVDEARKGARTLVPIATRCADDPATLALVRAGDTLGVTQLESPAMRHLIIQMRPRGLDDIIQALALLRPGAASIGMKELFIRRRHGQESMDDVNPIVAAVLGETNGLMLYEDDSLRLIQALTGLPAANADRLRKRISKHRTEDEAEALRREFMGLCAGEPGRVNGEPGRVNGEPGRVSAWSKDAASDSAFTPGANATWLASSTPGANATWLASIWQQLAKFNRYTFCKSHAVSYGLIAWQAAYLKAHHPAAFWTAALNNAQGAYSRWVYIEAIRRAGISVLPPCVNRSPLAFRLEDGAIRTGLEAIGGLSEQLCSQIIQQRDQNGPYRDLADLRRRAGAGPEALSTLIRAGALGFTGKNRPALVLEARLGTPPAGELFALDPTEGWSPPDDPPLACWRDQWQTLGFVLGPALFSLFQRSARPLRGIPLVGSDRIPDFAGKLVQVQGLVATARNVVTEDGRPLQFVTLEDGLGLIEVTLFDGACPHVPYLTIGPYVATGIVEDRHGACTLTARSFTRMGVTSSA